MSEAAMDVTATAHEDHLAEASVGSGQTATAPPDDTGVLPPVGPPMAWLSTDLGTRPPRKAPSPPFAPPVVYSDPVAAVVHTSHFWRKKYPRTVNAIFPGCGWTIEDFWDPEDIHIYGADHCREVLKFTGQYNVVLIRHFAWEWSLKHPERLTNYVGRITMEELYDETRPETVVERVFTDGERNEYPPQFLYHALNLMRYAMVKAMARDEPVPEPRGVVRSYPDGFVFYDPDRNVAPRPEGNLTSPAEDTPTSSAEGILALPPGDTVASPPERNAVSPLEGTLTSPAKGAVVAPPDSTVASPPKGVVELPSDRNVASSLEGTAASPPPQQELSVTTKDRDAAIDPVGPGTANVSSTQHNLPKDKEPEPSPTAFQAPTTVIQQPPSTHNVLPLGEKRPPTHGPQQMGHYHGQPTGHVVGGMPTPTMAPPPMGGPTLVNSKIRSGRSGSYNQSIPGAYGENLPHMPPYPRNPPESTLSAQSPHFNPTAMPMGPVAMANPYPMPPYAPVYQPSSPSVYSPQPYHPGLVSPAMMHPHHNHMSGPPVASGYIQPASTVRGPRVTSMGDMTNASYYNNNPPPQDMDLRRTARHNNFYGNGNNLLYDPYNGAKPAFNDRNVGRKPSRGGFMEQQGGRSRKLSESEHRPRTGSYGNDWSNMPGTSHRFPDHRPPRAHMRDDPVIIGDPLRGCHQNWIGPENHNVNELFVSDMPEGVQQNDIQNMFIREINITPVRVTIRQNSGVRPHAFVLFSSTAEARLALKLGDTSPKIRGIPVRVTVPRRFYQKTEDSHNPHGVQQLGNMRNEERATHNVTRVPSREAKSATPNTKIPITQPMYSPQDARSDLQKKANSFSLETDAASRGSPKGNQTNTCNSFPSGQGLASSEDYIKGKFDGKAAKSSPLLGPMTGSNYELDAKPAVKEALVAKDAVELRPPTDANDTQELQGPMIKSRSLAIDQNTPVAGPSQPLASQHGTQVGHARVDSQSKATFDSDDALLLAGSDAATAVVKIPSAVKDDTILTQQSTAMSGVDKSEDSPHHDLGSPPSEPPESDDGADPESSFLSAQENVDRGEPTLEPRADLVATDQETLPSKSVPDTSSQKVSSFSQPTTAQEDSQHSLSHVGQEAVSVSISATVGSTGGSHMEEIPAKSENTAATKQTTHAEAVKQQGPQQTPSLNPFAKPSKSERRKEKEQKKREQKKQQGEKAAKAKAGKVFLTTTNPNPEPPANLNSKEPVASLDPPISNSNTPSSEDKTKIKVRQSDTNILDQNSKVESKDTAVGMYNGSIVADIPNELGLVTREAVAVPEAMTTPTEKDVSVAFTLLSLAQSPKQEEARAEELAVTAKPATVNVNDAASTSINKTAPASPNLDLHSHSSASGAQNPLPDTSGLTEVALASKHASLTLKNPRDSQPDKAMATASNETKAASVTGSDTMNADDGTKASPPSSQAQTPKPKKKRNKKKKKSTAPAAVDEATSSATVAGSSTVADSSTVAGSSTGDAATGVANAKGKSPSLVGDYDYDADPFGHQMSHIDAIRAANKRQDTFYNTVNRERAERAAKQKQNDGTASTTNFAQDSVMENVRAHQALLDQIVARKNLKLKGKEAAMQKDDNAAAGTNEAEPSPSLQKIIDAARRKRAMREAAEKDKKKQKAGQPPRDKWYWLNQEFPHWRRYMSETEAEVVAGAFDDMHIND